MRQGFELAVKISFSLLLFIASIIYVGNQDVSDQSKYPMKNGTCCYYRQHFHNAYCGNNAIGTQAFGCILTRALIEGPPVVICSTNGRCLPPEGEQGYWLEGFDNGCDVC